MLSTPYSETIGALLHLSTKTRPEIAHSVSVLARYNSNPGKRHWNCVKQVLRYLKGTNTFGLVLGGDTLELYGSVDANFAQNPDNRKSYVGFMFKFGNGAISSCSVSTKTVMTSSCETEIAAMFYGCSEAIWLRRLAASFGYCQSDPTLILGDNQGALKWSNNCESNGRMKHINCKFFFVRERITTKEIKTGFIPSTASPSDILTKSLPPKTFRSHRATFGIFPHSTESG